MAHTARPPPKAHTVAYDVPNPISEIPRTSTAGKPRNGERRGQLMGSGSNAERRRLLHSEISASCKQKLLP